MVEWRDGKTSGQIKDRSAKRRGEPDRHFAGNIHCMDEGHALAKEAHFSNSRKIADSIKNGVSRFKPKKSLFRGPQGGVPPRGEGGGRGG